MSIERADLGIVLSISRSLQYHGAAGGTATQADVTVKQQEIMTVTGTTLNHNNCQVTLFKYFPREKYMKIRTLGEYLFYNILYMLCFSNDSHNGSHLGGPYLFKNRELEMKTRFSAASPSPESS